MLAVKKSGASDEAKHRSFNEKLNKSYNSQKDLDSVCKNFFKNKLEFIQTYLFSNDLTARALLRLYQYYHDYLGYMLEYYEKDPLRILESQPEKSKELFKKLDFFDELNRFKGGLNDDPLLYGKRLAALLKLVIEAARYFPKLTICEPPLFIKNLQESIVYALSKTYDPDAENHLENLYDQILDFFNSEVSTKHPFVFPKFSKGRVLMEALLKLKLSIIGQCLSLEHINKIQKIIFAGKLDDSLFSIKYIINVIISHYGNIVSNTLKSQLFSDSEVARKTLIEIIFKLAHHMVGRESTDLPFTTFENLRTGPRQNLCFSSFYVDCYRFQYKLQGETLPVYFISRSFLNFFSLSYNASSEISYNRSLYKTAAMDLLSISNEIFESHFAEIVANDESLSRNIHNGIAGFISQIMQGRGAHELIDERILAKFALVSEEAKEALKEVGCKRIDKLMEPSDGSSSRGEMTESDAISVLEILKLLFTYKEAYCQEMLLKIHNEYTLPKYNRVGATPLERQNILVFIKNYYGNSLVARKLIKELEIDYLERTEEPRDVFNKCCEMIYDPISDESYEKASFRIAEFIMSSNAEVDSDGKLNPMGLLVPEGEFVPEEELALEEKLVPINQRKKPQSLLWSSFFNKSEKQKKLKEKEKGKDIEEKEKQGEKEQKNPLNEEGKNKDIAGEKENGSEKKKDANIDEGLRNAVQALEFLISNNQPNNQSHADRLKKQVFGIINGNGKDFQYIENIDFAPTPRVLKAINKHYKQIGTFAEGMPPIRQENIASILSLAEQAEEKMVEAKDATLNTAGPDHSASGESGKKEDASLKNKPDDFESRSPAPPANKTSSCRIM